MTQLYYSTFTDAGIALLTESINNGTKLGITHMAVGDGNGTLPTPDSSADRLVNEVYRTYIDSLAPDEDEPNWLKASAMIAGQIGGFNIRELGLYAGDVLVAYSNYPTTYKPSTDDGASKSLNLVMIIQINNINHFELVIDPNLVVATLQAVEQIKTDLQTKLDIGAIKGFANYEELRASSTTETSIRIAKEGFTGQFLLDQNDTTSVVNGGTIIVDALNRRWKRQYNGRADIRWFGAVVGTDSTTAIQKALNAKIPLSIKGKYYVNAQLTATNYIDIEGGNNLSDALIWLSTAPSDGIKATFDNWFSEASISKLGILTQKQGVGTAIQFDATEALTKQLAGTNSANYFNRFRKISQCMIRAESINTALYGWKNGIELNCPFAIEIKDNEIYGKASASAAIASNFIENSVGVHVTDQTLRTLANIEVSNNRIFNFYTACKVYNVEGFTFTNNDLQVDFDGLVILNTIMKVNQYRINLNHIGVTNDGIVVSNARQVLIHQNELSYRNSRTEVGAEVYMIKLESVYSFNVVGNSIRGNKFNNDDVLINGILLYSTTDITRDGSITANQFQNLNNGVVSGTGKHIKVIVAGNNFDGMRGLKLVNDRSPARNAQFQIGNGDFSTTLDNLNPALRVENTGALSILALRPNGGAVAAFGTNGIVGNISVTDTAVTYNTTSDQTLKNDQGLASKSEATEIVNQIDIHNFNWKVNDQHDIGAFAQELYQVYPSAVTKGGWLLEDGSMSDTEVEGSYYQAWSVDYSKLIPLLILSIQNLSN